MSYKLYDITHMTIWYGPYYTIDLYENLLYGRFWLWLIWNQTTVCAARDGI